MANYTENYQLEKPLPEEFYDVGVQNGNWDKIDAAIAAIDATKAEEKGDLADDDALPLVDSADSSKTKRVLWSTVKAALAKLFVPLTRKINGKALREDLTLTGEDIKVSGSDETSISSSLSNKAASSLGQVPENDLLTWADKQTISGAFGINPSVTTEGVPVVGWYHGFLEVKASGRRMTLTEPSGQYSTWINCTSGDIWTKWMKQATATPSQEYDLPLADGISDYATSVYHKNQFSEVSVRVSVAATNSIQNGATIATLPEGFRPAKSIDTAATGYVSGSSWFACRLVIQPSGAVQVYWGIGSSPATFIVGSFAPYLAVD